MTIEIPRDKSEWKDYARLYYRYYLDYLDDYCFDKFDRYVEIYPVRDLTTGITYYTAHFFYGNSRYNRHRRRGDPLGFEFTSFAAAAEAAEEYANNYIVPNILLLDVAN